MEPPYIWDLTLDDFETEDLVGFLADLGFRVYKLCCS